jgi:hypothetical protein
LPATSSDNGDHNDDSSISSNIDFQLMVVKLVMTVTIVVKEMAAEMTVSRPLLNGT